MWNSRRRYRNVSHSAVHANADGAYPGKVMIMKHKIVAAAVALAGVAVAPNAYAGGSVTASYFTLTSSNPDVEGQITDVTLGLVQKTLGPDGLPVESKDGTFGDVNSAGELLWWSPDGVNVLAGTKFVYPGTVPLPFDIQSNFFPNGTTVPPGTNGGDVGYTSAILTATFVAPAGGTVTFNLGSDDDAWVFLNGTLVVDNGGIHALATAPTMVSDLTPGSTNTVEVFFADRHTTQSGLFFNADVELTPSAVPEASTWAMMLTGFAGLGFAAFRRARKTAPTIA
jgi:fibro-slime domain-containing protein